MTQKEIEQEATDYRNINGKFVTNTQSEIMLEKAYISGRLKSDEEKDREIERLKGLIWRMYDGESLPDTKEQFKTENNL